MERPETSWYMIWPYLWAPTWKFDVPSATVKNEGKLHYQRLDYMGYAMVEQDQQEILQRYAEDQISLAELIMLLEQ